MVSAPSTAAVSNGTAIKAASRHRTRQFLRANRDQAEPGRLRWVVPTTPTAGGGRRPPETARLRPHAPRARPADAIRAVTRAASAREGHRTLPVGWSPAD